MYYSFFGLSQPPFKITPDTEMFFDGGNRGAILEALIYAITQGEGIVKVTGEVGSGKTMLCRMLQTRLPDSIETIYLANPSVSREEILHAIAFELQLPVPKDASRIEAMHRINDYLLQRHAEGRQVVLFVEESQSMPVETLEEVRLLSNLETNHHKLLQIVLFGQPELDDNLRRPEIRQLRERITHSFSLTPLTSDDVRLYLTFRLRTAGYRGPDLFNRRVVDYISRVSEGLTRRVNIIADKALLAAFADGTHNVTIKHIAAAVRDTEFGSAAVKAPVTPLGYIAVGLFVGAAIGIAALIVYQQLRQAQDDHSSAAIARFAAPDQAAYQVENRATYQPEPGTPASSSQPGAAEAGVEAPQESGHSTDAGDAPLSQEPEDLLEQRLRETTLWLAQADDSQLTIQLLGSNNAEYLRSDLETIGNIVELDRVFVYRTVAHERPLYIVLLGTYGSRAEAFQEINALPESMKANGPYFRTIKGVKQEIARNGV